MRSGVLSIGTNSTRALVADVANAQPSIELARSTGTRIGEGLREHGRIDDAAAQRTLDALVEHVSAVRALTADYCLIATSAMRRADNAQSFAERAAAVTGVPLQIIDGEDEARRSFAGAMAGFRDDIPTGVLDVGGGSAEYAIGSFGNLQRTISCEIGAVRLTEMHPVLRGELGKVDAAAIASAASDARSALKEMAGFEAVQRIIIVGGTATTAIAMLRGKRTDFAYEPLQLEALNSLIARLAGATLPERRTIAGLNPQRADIVLGGCIILRECFALTGHTQALVSTNDLLLGTLLLREQ